MDLARIISELRAERDRVNEAILALERLASFGRSRGRSGGFRLEDIRVNLDAEPAGKDEENGRKPRSKD